MLAADGLWYFVLCVCRGWASEDVKCLSSCCGIQGTDMWMC